MYFKHILRFGHRYIRFDSLHGNLLSYSPGSVCGSHVNEKIVDSLSLPPGNGFTCSFENVGCVSVTNSQVFGMMTDVKRFFHGTLMIEYRDYAKNFGIVSSCAGDPDCSSFTALLGCRIDGIVYGDTNLTNIRQVNSSIPDKFSLSQNYPNPFNPNTIITYSLPITQYVTLKVYDVNGRQVSTLVDHGQNSGSYEVEFNGESISSGIYFYELRAGDFVETKRMILIK